MTDWHTPRKLPHRVEWISPADDAERLRKIREKTTRASYHPDDSLCEPDAPARERHDPQGWNYRHD